MEHIELISLVSDLSAQIEIAEEELDNLKNKRFDILISLRDQGVPLRVLGSVLGIGREGARQQLDAYELRKFRAGLPKD